MKKFLSIAFLSLSLSLVAQKGDKKGVVMIDPIPAEQIPPAPVLSGQDALASFQIQKGFSIEKVASEPQVFNPVTLTFDGNGRMWVCEMKTYMPNVDGSGEEVPKSSISILEDTNNDGAVDKRTVFLDKVIIPRSIAMVKGGILYADHTQLYFAEVLPGLKLGKHEVVDPTYAKGGSLEHKSNAMTYGLDGWYYNAKSNKRYKALPLDAKIPVNAKEIYRNNYFVLVLGSTESRGQWGMSVDDYGRLYHNGNSSCATGENLMPSQTLHNPKYRPKTKAARIGANRVYPIRMNPGINRGYIERMLIKDGEHRGKLANFTAASGNAIYRGDQFPESFYHTALTPEPAAHLVSIRKIIDKQGQLSGKELYAQQELLASTDERFRPVNLFTAPDGSLYILDMYHGILQHKEFVTSYLRRQILSRGLDKQNNDRGRIYRLRWTENQLGKQPNMLSMTVNQLVPLLAHANGWWRDTARRLIVQSNDKSIVNNLTQLYKTTQDHRAKINILWTLDGLNSLNPEIIESALSDKHVKVNIAGIILGSHIQDQKLILAQLESVASKNVELTTQVLLNSGQYTGPEALQLLNRIMAKSSSKAMLEAAAIGIANRTDEFKNLLASEAHPALLKKLDSIQNKKAPKSNAKKLPSWAKNLYTKGEKLFKGKAACFGCHGANGEGIDNMGPPLAKSEWVTGSPERLAKIMLHGMSGSITVNKKKYSPVMIMPGLGANPSINDEELASIATFIRNNWGNKAGGIKADLFKKVRVSTANQALPFTAKDFQ